jgi:hypothetical protein
MVERYVVALIKEARTPYLRGSGPVKGRLQVDLDELMNQHLLFGGPPLTGRQLAKFMSLSTLHELEAFARKHGTGRIQDLLEPLDAVQPAEPSGPKQIIFGTDLKPQPMPGVK